MVAPRQRFADCGSVRLFQQQDRPVLASDLHGQGDGFFCIAVVTSAHAQVRLGHVRVSERLPRAGGSCKPLQLGHFSTQLGHLSAAGEGECSDHGKCNVLWPDRYARQCGRRHVEVCLRIRQPPGVPLHGRQAAEPASRVEALAVRQRLLCGFPPRGDCGVAVTGQFERLGAFLL